jgi:tetratricopeptide (TPR) repeat protein
MIQLLNNDFVKAEVTLKGLEKTTKDAEIKPLVLLALIQTNYFQNDFVEAEKYAQLITSNYATHNNVYEAYYWLGRVALERDDYSKASQYLEQASVNKSTSMIDYLAFQINIKQGKAKAAKAIMESSYAQYEDEYVNQIVLEWFNYLYEHLWYKAIVRDSNFRIPNYSRLHSDYAIIVGQANYKLGNYDRALSILKTINPTTDKKQFHIALAYKAKGDFTLANAIFEELADNSEVKKIKDLSFFELVNNRIKVPVGNKEVMVSIKADNNNWFKRVEDFSSNNPNSEFIGNAYYLMGYIKYLNEEYDTSLNWFLKANNSRIDSDTSEKMLFLIGDIYFLSKQKSKAIPMFNYYKELYPEGRFYDEVLYKIGLTYFDSDVFNESEAAFVELAKKYTKFKNLSSVYFYLGEINTINTNYETAIDWFEMALEDSIDPTAVWLRIAEVQYLLEDWESCLSSLDNVPASPLYTFRVNLIKGNIFYNKKEYDRAIEHYNKSSQVAVEDSDITLITSRIGWTYYLKNDYAQAEKIFRTLSNFSTSSEDYLILAGNSALNGKRFIDAISLFKEFILTHPISNKLNYVRLNLGDAYYNLNKYKESLETYVEILENNPTNKELKNALLGIKWSVLNDKNRDNRSKLATIANKIKNPNIAKTLTQIILLYENENKKWEDVIRTANELITTYPADKKNKNVNKNLAYAYSQQKEFAKADSVYANLAQWHKDAEVFTAWSDAFLARKDSSRAIKVLADAAKLSSEPDVWLKLLELKLEVSDTTFTSSFNEFLPKATGLVKDYTRLLNERHKFIKKESIDLDYINRLAENDDTRIASYSYFLIGLNDFSNKKYDEASLNMMRILYLFPEYKLLNQKAAYYLITSQLQAKDHSKAQKNYDAYKHLLLDWQKKQLMKRL